MCVCVYVYVCIIDKYVCMYHTYRYIRTGGCFGSTEFMSGTVSGKFKWIASVKTVILELTAQSVSSIIDCDYTHGALFYWTLCQVKDLILEATPCNDNVYDGNDIYIIIFHSPLLYRLWTSTTERPWKKCFRAPGLVERQ